MQARVRRRDPSAGTRTGGIPGWALADAGGSGLLAPTSRLGAALIIALGLRY